MIKNIPRLFAICVCLVLCPNLLFSQTTPEEILDDFFLLYEQNSLSAIESIFSNSTSLRNSNDKTWLNKIKRNLKYDLKHSGDYLGHQLIKKSDIVECYRVYSFIMKHENYPLKFIFTFYKPKNRWHIQDFQYNLKIDDRLLLNTIFKAEVHTPSKHNIGLSSLNLFGSKNIYGLMMFAGLNYSYSYKSNIVFKFVAGIAYDRTQLIFGPYVSEDTWDMYIIRKGYASVESGNIFMLGYEQFLLNRSVTPFAALSTGILSVGYNEPYAYGKNNTFICGLIQLGMNFENQSISFKPSIGYFITNSTDIYGKYYNGIKPENPDVIGKGKFNSPMFCLELGFKF